MREVEESIWWHGSEEHRFRLAFPGNGRLHDVWQCRAQAGAAVKIQLMPKRLFAATMMDGAAFVMVMRDMQCMFHHVLDHPIRSVREMPPRCRQHLQRQAQHEKKDRNARHSEDSRPAPPFAVPRFARERTNVPTLGNLPIFVALRLTPDVTSADRSRAASLRPYPLLNADATPPLTDALGEATCTCRRSLRNFRCLCLECIVIAAEIIGEARFTERPQFPDEPAVIVNSR